MTTLLSKVLTYAACPAVAVLAGALIALVREPGPGMRSAVQHFAAGTVFSVLAVELLPDLMHRHIPWPTFIGFSLGVAFMLVLKRFGDHESESDSGRNTRSLVAAMGLDVGLDGTDRTVVRRRDQAGTAADGRARARAVLSWRLLRDLIA